MLLIAFYLDIHLKRQLKFSANKIQKMKIFREENNESPGCLIWKMVGVLVVSFRI